MAKKSAGIDIASLVIGLTIAVGGLAAYDYFFYADGGLLRLTT